MAYKIRYVVPKQKKKSHFFRFQVLTAAVLLVFLLLVHLFSPQSSAAIQRYLLSEEGYTLNAAEILVNQLEDGAPFWDALDAFCTCLTDAK